MVGFFAQKPPRTPTKPTIPGGWHNKVVVETAGYLYSHHRRQICSYGTRPQVFPGQERGIGRSRQRRSCRRGHRGCSAAQVMPYTPTGTAASQNLRGGCHDFTWTRPGSAWTTWLCWREAKALAGTSLRAPSEQVCRATRNEGKRPWLREDETRPDEGAMAEAWQTMRVCQDTAANLLGRVVALPGQHREPCRTRLHGLN